MRKLVIITIFIIIASAASGCRSEQQTDFEPFAKNHVALNTVNRITIYDKSRRDAELILDAAFSRIDEVEAAMSLYIDESEINQINRQAGVKSVQVSQETFDLLLLAEESARLSQGAFDPTIGPLVTAWGITSDNPRIPDDEELDVLLELVNYRNLVMEQPDGVFLAREGMKLDLGGIAKGYAADEAKRIIREMGSSSALINLGGNILLAGSKPDGTPWRIGVQDPHSSRGRYIVIITLEGGTVVTSGTYERYFFDNDIRYHHILDTSTGFPADTGLESVTIVTENSAYADALSTAAFVLGIEEGFAFIESIEDVEAVFITEDKRVFKTSGFSSPDLGVSLSHDDYRIIEGSP